MSSSDGNNKRRNTLIEQMLGLGQTANTETALFHQTAAAKLGLGITEMKALSILLQEGDMTAGQIAKRLSLTTGAVTSLLDRLERRNMVSRHADPKDRRKVIVVFNQKNLASTDNVYRSMGESFRELLSNYSAEQLEFLVRFHEQSIELTKQEIAKLASPET